MSLDRGRLHALRGEQELRGRNAAPAGELRADATVADQFGAMIHVDETTALQPLETGSQRPEESPETYRTGL